MKAKQNGVVGMSKLLNQRIYMRMEAVPGKHFSTVINRSSEGDNWKGAVPHPRRYIKKMELISILGRT